MNNTALSAEKTKKENIIFISDAHEKFYYEKNERGTVLGCVLQGIGILSWNK